MIKVRGLTKNQKATRAWHYILSDYGQSKTYGADDFYAKNTLPSLREFSETGVVREHGKVLADMYDKHITPSQYIEYVQSTGGDVDAEQLEQEQHKELLAKLQKEI